MHIRTGILCSAIRRHVPLRYHPPTHKRLLTRAQTSLRHIPYPRSSMSRTLRPSLPSLPLPLSGALSCTVFRSRGVAKRPRSRRPPAHPASHTSTWRAVAAGAAQTAGAHPPDVDVVGVALLAAEARRRRFIVRREKAFFVQRASPLLQSRVHTLEKELRTILRCVEKCKIVALAKRKLKAATKRHSLPVSALLNEESTPVHFS